MTGAREARGVMSSTYQHSRGMTTAKPAAFLWAGGTLPPPQPLEVNWCMYGGPSPLGRHHIPWLPGGTLRHESG